MHFINLTIFDTIENRKVFLHNCNKQRQSRGFGVREGADAEAEPRSLDYATNILGFNPKSLRSKFLVKACVLLIEFRPSNK